LQEKLQDYPGKSDLKIAVPKLVSLSHEEISNHLSEKFPSWQKGWKDFVENFKNQQDKNSLDSKSKEILSEIRAQIKEAFAKNIFGAKIDELGHPELVMVRSTSMEDSVDLPNPGGNDSKPSKCDQASISEAIGEVVASYFSEKSLSQRLKGKDDITKDPFMPVLIQNLVGEGFSNENGQVYSGVIYSGNSNSKIQIAPGHGELIVNSKGNFDDLYVTSQNIVYAEVQNKDFRLKPKYDKETNKLTLVEEDNEVDIALSPSVSESVAQEMHKIAQYIEKIYGMRMDIEFVYDPSNKTISIVQARPIPEGDRANHIPSALDPVYIKQIIKDGGQIFKGNTITPEVNHAVKIENNQQIIVCNRIEEALDTYLKNSNDIKAVVVKHNAPNTGHEAGEFSSKAIPVINIPNLDKIEKLLEELKGGKKIIVDPQRKSVFQLPENPSQKVIAEGIFKSALTSNVSSYKHNFPIIEDTKFVDNVHVKDLGGLIAAAKNNDKEATEKLLSYVWTNYFQDNKSKPSLEQLNKALEVLENPYGNVKDHPNALRTVLKLAADLHKADKISQDLFIQIVITGTELGRIISQDLETIGSRIFPDENDKQKIYTEYLNVFEKLEGAIKAQPEKNILSDSIFTNLAENHYEQSKLKLVKDQEWNETQKANFVTAAKLEQFFISETSKANWINFCKEICSGKYSHQLANLVGNIAKLGIHAQWCNSSFVKNYKENEGKPLVALEKMLNEAKVIVEKKNDLKIIDRAINELKKQIALWKEPENFEELHKKFQVKLGQIKEKLKINNDASALEIMVTAKQMHDLVGSLDLTIKSLEKSTVYKNKIQQAKNFQIILRDFAELMKDWFKDAGITNGEEIVNKVEEMLSKASVTEQDLSPSGNFAVNSATIDWDYTQEGWTRTLINCKNLEDGFTMIHQNMEAIVSNYLSKTSKNLMNELPETVKNLNVSLTGMPNYPAKLSAIEINYPALILHYNVPLQNHSALVKVKYDFVSRDTSLNYFISGHNVENRLDKIEFASQVKLNLLTDIEIVKKPCHSEEKTLFEFDVKVKSKEEGNFVTDLIDELNQMTFYLNKLNIILPGQLELEQKIHRFDSKNLERFETTKSTFLFLKSSSPVYMAISYSPGKETLIRAVQDTEMEDFRKLFIHEDILTSISNENREKYDNLFHIALDSNYLILAQALIERGFVDINSLAKNGNTVLWDTIYSRHYGLVKWLIKNGADLNAKDKNNTTPIMYALMKYRLELIMLLIENKAALNIVNDEGITPLHYVVSFHDVEDERDHRHIAELLLSYGARWDMRNFNGKTPMDWAEKKKDKTFFNLFKEYEEKEKQLLLEKLESILQHPSSPESENLANDINFCEKVIEKFGFKYLPAFSHSQHIDRLFIIATVQYKDPIKDPIIFLEKEWNSIYSVIENFFSKVEYEQLFKNFVLPKFALSTLELALNIEQQKQSESKNLNLIELLQSEYKNQLQFLKSLETETKECVPESTINLLQSDDPITNKDPGLLGINELGEGLQED
jgi:phosphohistidine swiveling domain-containing protein